MVGPTRVGRARAERGSPWGTGPAPEDARAAATEAQQGGREKGAAWLISFLRGIVAAIGEDWVDLDVGGIGFRAALSAHALRSLPPVGAEVILPTVLTLREDGASLFAFRDESERHAFRALAGVSGVGGRTALAVLSVLRPDALAAAVEAEDLAALTAAQGVGRKTAQRLVLELKGRLPRGADPLASPQPAASGPEAEACAALLALGYSEAEAVAAVDAVRGEAQGTAEKVRAALRRLAGG